MSIFNYIYIYTFTYSCSCDYICVCVCFIYKIIITHAYTYDLKSCNEDIAHALLTVGFKSLRVGVVLGLFPQPKSKNWNPKTLEPGITEFCFWLAERWEFCSEANFWDYLLWNIKFIVLGLHNMCLKFALLVNHRRGRIAHFPDFVENKDNLANCVTMWAAQFINWLMTPL